MVYCMSYNYWVQNNTYKVNAWFAHIPGFRGLSQPIAIRLCISKVDESYQIRPAITRFTILKKVAFT